MMPAAETRAGLIAIVGRPNVGKSTLLNRLVGQKLSITSRKPQTTRHRIRGIVTTERAQCVFVDTPGLQGRGTNALGGAMNRAVTHALAEVDVLVLVVDAARYTDDDERVVRLLPPERPLIVAVNKLDRLADHSALLPYIERLAQRVSARAIVPVSAQRGDQIAALMQEIEQALPVQPRLYPDDQLTDRDERFFASELVREKIFRLLGDEVPYATTVVIEKFEQRGRIRHIHATIFVDKPSHKAIVIGEDGARLKMIASQARKDMEAMFAGKVYLRVWVKVRRGWADDGAQLERLGYE